MGNPPAPSAVPRQIATVFGLGRCPIAPGTVASLAAIPFAWVMLQLPLPYGRALLFVAALATLALGVWATSVYAAACANSDPSEAVIDEVVGQWFTLVFAGAEQPLHFVAGFLLFRLFDIAKPWPASWAERHLPAGWGIMMDDIVAAIYAALLLYFGIWAVEHPYIANVLRGAP